MEHWSTGVLVKILESKSFQYSTTPLLQYTNQVDTAEPSRLNPASRLEIHIALRYRGKNGEKAKENPQGTFKRTR